MYFTLISVDGMGWNYTYYYGLKFSNKTQNRQNYDVTTITSLFRRNFSMLNSGFFIKRLFIIWITCGTFSSDIWIAQWTNACLYRICPRDEILCPCNIYVRDSFYLTSSRTADCNDITWPGDVYNRY